MGTQRALGALEFLTQDADPSGTTLGDARNGFNDLIRLSMIWTVRHRWPAGGEAHVQLLYALGTTSDPPAGGAASHNLEQRVGNSGRPPLNGIVRDHPRSPCQGAKSDRFRVVTFVLCGRCGVRRFGTTNCTAPKAIDREGGPAGGISLIRIIPSSSWTHQSRRWQREESFLLMV